jgi:hypothetical protein
MSDKGPRIYLPNEFADASGVVRLRPGADAELGGEGEIIRSILGPGSVVAMTRPPSFEDQLHVYATHQELHALMVESELASYLQARERSTEDVVELLRPIPFAPAMRLVASLQKALAFGRVDQEWQRKLMYDVYMHGAISRAGDLWLAGNERGAIFSEQQLFALQRLLVLHASDDEADDLTPDQHAALRMALLFVPGTVLSTHDEELADAPDVLDDERWLRYFVGNGGFAAHGWLKHDMPRAHMLYEVLAKSRLVAGHVDFCPLEEWLQAEYRMSFVELQAFGFVIFAGSHVGVNDGPPLAVKPDYFSSSAFATRTEDGFKAFAADRAWFQSEFLRTPETPRRAAYDIQPFLRRPALRQPDGTALVAAPRAIEGWLSATGAYYRFIDLARAEDDETRMKFSRFNGLLQEHYARRLTHIACPYPKRRGTLAVGKVYGEQPYRKRKQEMRTSDVAIDLGTDLVLIEITAKRLAEKTLVEADAESVRDDLRMMIQKKMQQLGRVIGDVFDEPSRLPQVELQFVHRVWPVVVCGEGIFHTPTIWAYTDSRAGGHLKFSRDRVHADVQPVVLVDLEELELLMGLVQEGESLTGLLERKTSALWLARDLKAMVSDQYAGRGSGDTSFITQVERRAFKRIKRALDLAGAGTPEEPAQQAA